MTVDTAPFLDVLKAATTRADADEARLREEYSQRLKLIEQGRAFAYRRYNLMSAVSGAVAGAESEEIAVANAQAMLRSRLNWHSDSESRNEIVTKFAPVGRAVFATLAPPEAEADELDVMGALNEFETWYASRHGSSFWILFETYIPETPVVDF